MDHGALSQIAAVVLKECLLIEEECRSREIALPSLEAGKSGTAFWSDAASTELAAARTRALGHLEELADLLRGPHGLLHELVAPNWDHGALYAFLQSGTLEHLASSSGGRASLSSLSKQSKIPEDKLFRILALLRCRNIVGEPEDGIYTLTAVSEELVGDPDFRAWVEFQLFETRVASAHLGEALINKPNDYASGASGFKMGWGIEMYDWHNDHPGKGDRFRRAMRGVSKSLDPADALLHQWFQGRNISNRTKVIEIGGRYGFASLSLALIMPELSFEIRCDSHDFLRQGQQARAKASESTSEAADVAFTYVKSVFDLPCSVDSDKDDNDGSDMILAYVVRNLFWNWADDDVVRLLNTTLLPTLRKAPSVRILVTDGVSPSREFPPHVEIAYRRRDITTMTMHNVKQRTQAEWLLLFSRADPELKVNATFAASSHVYKGLWELALGV